MSTPTEQLHQQPFSSQCEDNLEQSKSSSPQQPSLPPSLNHQNFDSTCKVSPFKPNTSKKRKLPFPTLTPIPVQTEHAKPEPVTVPRVSHVPASVPPDIDVPSPPVLSSSDEQEPQLDNSQQCIENITKQGQLLEIQPSRHTSPKTDTCDPPECSQDSAFFSFANLPSQPNVETSSVQHDTTTTTPPQPRERYYTRAFEYVITEVLQRYHYILPSQDLDIARILRHTLSENAQALFVRIYARKQPQWYRVSKLEQAYAADIDIHPAIDELCRENFLMSSMYALRRSPKSASLLARELLSTLDLSELRLACASLVDGSKLKRFPRNRLLPELTKLLSNAQSSRRSKKKFRQTTLSGLKPSDCLAHAVLKLAGHSVRVPDLILSALRRIRFLFFLEDGHDSPNVILADTGKVKFPAYKCQPRRGIFPSSQALQDYESAVELEQCIDESLEDKDWSRAAYFGSIAELELREFFNFGQGEEQGTLPNHINSTAGLFSSRRPALTKRINREEQLEQLNHPFLRRYTAQWVFVRSCWHSVHALERLSEYQSAVSRLKLLLSTNMMPRRRGKCLTRLTINLFKHLGELEEPLKIIVSALSSTESHLHLGDQIGLAQRGAAIHAKMLAKGIPAEIRDDAGGETGSDRRTIAKLNSSRPRVIVEALERGATEVSVRKIFGKSLNVQNREEKDRISKIQDPWLRYVEENRNDPQLEKLRGDLPIMGKSVFMSRQGTGDRVSVEEYCLQWYSAKEELTGAHDEGKSIRFLFTLLLWECALFAEVPDVFQTPYQDRPLDLYTEAFYLSRKEDIDVRLAEIVSMSSEDIYAETLSRYQQFEGTKAIGCSWTSYSAEGMSTIAAGLGGKALAHCCGLLAKDYTYWGGGLPDLTLWKVDDDDSTRKQYKTKLVEVKSARDTLCERQRAWLIELRSCGVECEVCKVVEKVTARSANEIEDITMAPASVNINNLDTKGIT